MAKIVQEGLSGTSGHESEVAMRLTGKPGEWLWRRLRLGTWFTRRKAEKLTGTTAKADPDDAERGADRVIHREKVTSPQHRRKGRGGPSRHRKKRR
jgi:hypothetical protein